MPIDVGDVVLACADVMAKADACACVEVGLLGGLQARPTVVGKRRFGCQAAQKFAVNQSAKTPDALY